MLKAKNLTTVALTFSILAYWIVKVFLDADLVDDTYIFLRYAENFSSGQGLVFNADERVEGYTSPLWVLSLGALSSLHLDPILVSKILSALYGIATLLTLFYFARKYVPVGRELMMFIPVWFLATNPSFVYWTWSGMDTAIFTFLFCTTFFVFLKQVEKNGTMFSSGVCFLLASFARLDMLSLLPVYLLFIFYFNRHQKQLLLRKYGSFLAPSLLLSFHFLWRYHYYGILLPNTFYAKVNIPSHVLLKNGIIYGIKFALAYNLHFMAFMAAILIAAILIHLPKKLLAEWEFSVAVMAVWWAHVVCVGGDHLAMFRFFIPILPLLAFLFVSLVSWFISYSQIKVKWKTISISIVLIGSLSILNYSVYKFHGGERARREVELARSWAAVGQWFRKNVPCDTTIASLVVGAIPYYSGLTTYDLLGLTDREVATEGEVYLQGKIGHQKYSTDYILAQKPEYIIYSWSGLHSEPLYLEVESIDKSYGYALYDLASDERTKELYEYKAVRMENGKYIEFLHLRELSH